MNLGLGQLLQVFLGGGVGAVLRVLLSVSAIRLNVGLWVGTLAANVLGLMLILFWEFKSHSYIHLTPFVKWGAIGALTTFSTWGLEIIMSLKRGQFLQAGMIFLLNIFLGIGIGLWVFRQEVFH